MSRVSYPRGPAAQAPGLQPRTGTASKEFETLRAELALAGGHALQELADGAGYVVSRWNLAKHCRDLNEVRAFLAQVKGRAA